MRSKYQQLNRIGEGMEIEMPVHKDKATKIKKKLTKKEKEWSNLSAKEVFESKIFKVNELEKKFKFIIDNNELLLNNNDQEKLNSILNHSK